MNDNSSYVLGLIALIMVSVSCVFFVFYRAGGGRESRSKTVRYAGCLGKLLFAASVILLSVSVLNGFAKGEGFRENLVGTCNVKNEYINENLCPWKNLVSAKDFCKRKALQTQDVCTTPGKGGSEACEWTGKKCQVQSQYSTRNVCSKEVSASEFCKNQPQETCTISTPGFHSKNSTVEEISSYCEQLPSVCTGSQACELSN